MIFLDFHATTMSNITFTLNGKTVTTEAGSTILEAARENGAAIPTLCFQESLHAFGSCWMCIVEIKGKNRFVPACSTRVTDGIAVETDNAELYSIRRRNLERLLEGHDGDCNGPCEVSCPAGCDIPAFVSAIAHGNDHEAIRIIKDDIPLPGILGRICHAPCEEECRRHGVDEPLSICALKRFAADRDSESSERYLPSCKPQTGKKAAIIGAGPSGLTAAYYLLTEGHAVTIYDAHDAPGGMMRYGIPLFRLPAEVIEADLEPIRVLGAQFVGNTVFGRDISLESLEKEGFDAVYLAFGAQQAGRLAIPGAENEGVISGIDFLRRAASGETLDPGSDVLVIGGGNTAIDAARTALRLEAGSVRIVYRRTLPEMPANPAEVQEALHEGISIDVLTAPVAIKKAEDHLLVTTSKMRPGEPDESGRRTPVPVADSDATIPADLVISAVGQTVERGIHEKAGIAFSEKGAVAIEPETFRTSIPWVFAGGDCVSGADTAINAVRQGKDAARSIDAFLRGKPVAAPARTFQSSYGERDRAPEEFYQRSTPAPRTRVEELPLPQRIAGFDEVSAGFPEENARREAQRCLACSCTNKNTCRLRELASVYDVVQECAAEKRDRFSIGYGKTIRLERKKCVDCGSCVRTLEENGADGSLVMQLLVDRCPTGALSRFSADPS